jgi:LysM repeat protein
MRTVVLGIAVAAALGLAWPASASAGTTRLAGAPGVAALQVALKAKGHYTAPVDGLAGPQTQAALRRLRATHGITRERVIGPRTRAALGGLGRPLLGQRELWVGFKGWDVSALEFQLRAFGLPEREIDGTFTAATADALRRLQRANGLTPDGVAGKHTFRVLACLSRGTKTAAPKPVQQVHRVRPGESFHSIAGLYRVSPLLLARANDLQISAVIVPGQRLVLPSTAHPTGAGGTIRAPAVAVPRDAVRASLDRWSAAYGVDPRLSRAVAWMESGYQQHVVSHAGAIGVMQLLPETWQWLDALIGVRTPRTYDGNVRAGVRYLRWLLDEFDGDVRLALAGYYQGARAVRERGLFDDTKHYVKVILQLRGSV